MQINSYQSVIDYLAKSMNQAQATQRPINQSLSINSSNPYLLNLKSNSIIPKSTPKVSPIFGFDHIGYGGFNSDSNTLLANDTDKQYITAKLIIPVEANHLAGKLYENGLANAFNKEWQVTVALAAKANGGLGTNETGFLAWSKDGHFIRLNNPDMSAEHNRQLALMSLQGGFAVEDLPSRLSNADFSNPQHFHEKNDIVLGRHYHELSGFLANPKDGYLVSDGRSRYEIAYLPETGQVGSRYYKIARGLKGWIQKNYKWISRITNVVGTVGKFIPGWGTVASLASKAVQFAANSIASGKVRLQNLF